MEQIYSIVDSYPRSFQRFTWREQKTAQFVKILSSVYHQTGGTCAMHAVGASFEAKLRLRGEYVILSKVHLEELNSEAKRLEVVRPGRIRRMFMTLIQKGVLSEHDYKLGITTRTYKIRSFEDYNVRDPCQLSKALKNLTSEGPLIAVMNVSVNYLACFNSKYVYRFDPLKPMTETIDGVTRTITHAVSVVGFALEESVPCLECQDSQGKRFSRDGFLLVDITSIIELYSFVIC